jgi:hypothetical protein
MDQSLATKTCEQASASLRYANVQVAELEAQLAVRREASAG